MFDLKHHSNMHDSPAKAHTRSPENDTGSLHISSQAVLKLPLFRYTGPVKLVNQDKIAVQAVAELESEGLLGFDTETQPAFEKGQSFPTALVQLATAKKVFIFQLGALKKLDWFPRIFSAPQIIKVGIAIDQDIAKLRELSPFEPAGFVDLAHMAAHAGIKNRGLRALAALLMGIRVSKRARKSNWGNPHLSRHQITYAAGDAWLCRELFFRLRKLAVERKPAPPISN